MTKATTIGLDIAKQVFQVHGADKVGRAVLRLSSDRIIAAHDSSYLVLPLIPRTFCEEDLKRVVARHLLIAVPDFPDVHLVQEATEGRL